MMNTGNAMRTTVDDLAERIDVVYHETTQDAAGNIINTGTELSRGARWAKVLPISAVIADGYNENENAVTYRVTVRYCTDIEPTDTITWRGKRLSLVAPPYDAESRRVWTILDCRELIENG